MTNTEILEHLIGELRKLYRVGSVKPNAISLSPEQFDALCDIPAEVNWLREVLSEAKRVAAHCEKERDEAKLNLKAAMVLIDIAAGKQAIMAGPSLN